MVVQILILFDNLDFATAGSLIRFNHRRRKVLHIGWGVGGGGRGGGQEGTELFAGCELIEELLPPPLASNQCQIMTFLILKLFI